MTTTRRDRGRMISRRDLEFQLFEVLQAEKLCECPRFAEFDRDDLDAVIDSAFVLAKEAFAPLAEVMDRQEPELRDGRVWLPAGAQEAVDAYIDSGFLSACFDAGNGGIQLPNTVFIAASAVLTAANVGLSGYVGLTHAAASLLLAHASEQLKRIYAEPMVAGRFFGTMCLSEPQAGSSLADIRTRAMPTDQDYYRIEGSKMWISAGDHQLSENIVHLVLARIPGGPPGTRGISLFVVPKFRVNDDGSLGAANHVEVAGLNHKMGCRGTVNTVLNFGADGECRGFLVGEVNRGLACMFHMMNAARIGVGASAVALAYAAYRQSLDYARTRPQGRHVSNKDPSTPQLMLTEHADIRRLLLLQKVFAEGGLALVLYCSRLLDEQSAANSTQAALLLDILTPVAKSWPSEFCLESNKHAIQVMGGYGYSRDYAVERLYRDNRLNAIHEGTHGIQALDLLGRKVRADGGRAFRLLVRRIEADIEGASDNPLLAAYAASLSSTVAELVRTTDTLVACSKLDLSLSHATGYLDAFGHVVVAWMWLRQAGCASGQLAAPGDRDTSFYDGKLRACHFFFTYELPRAVCQLLVLQKLDDSLLTMPEDAYLGS